MGGSQFPVSNLRNVNVACRCRLSMAVSHVDSKKWSCPLSLSFLTTCRMSFGSICMSPVNLRNAPVAMSILGVYPHRIGLRKGDCILD